MKGLRRIHRPCDGEASAVRANDTRNTVRTMSPNEASVKCTPTAARKPEKSILDGGERGASQYLSQNDGRARTGAPARKQEAFVPVFNHRHHGEDRSEENDHHQRAGVEIIEIMLLPGGLPRTKGGPKARSEYDPKQKRRSDHAHHARALPIKRTTSRHQSVKAGNKTPADAGALVAESNVAACVDIASSLAALPAGSSPQPVAPKI